MWIEFLTIFLLKIGNSISLDGVARHSTTNIKLRMSVRLINYPKFKCLQFSYLEIGTWILSKQGKSVFEEAVF